MPDPVRSRQSRLRPHTQLIELRINAGLTRDDLAIKAGVGRETLRLVERTSFVPTERVQFAIAQVFELRPLDLWPLERQRAMQRSAR